MKRLISRIRRALDRRREVRGAPVMTEWEWMLLTNGRRYRAARPYIYGIIGRRDE